jgi:hypothetical protein
MNNKTIKKERRATMYYNLHNEKTISKRLKKKERKMCFLTKQSY